MIIMYFLLPVLYYRCHDETLGCWVGFWEYPSQLSCPWTNRGDRRDAKARYDDSLESWTLTCGGLGYTRETARICTIFLCACEIKESQTKGFTTYPPALLIHCTLGGKQQEARDWLSSQIPLGRMGTRTEIAEAAIFLASPLSSYVTGSVVVVDGGEWMTTGRTLTSMMALQSKL